MSTETAPDRYRRRNRLPVIAVILLLLIGGAVIWATALEPEAEAAKGCNAPGRLIPTNSSQSGTTSTGTTTDSSMAGSSAGTGSNTASSQSGTALSTAGSSTAGSTTAGSTDTGSTNSTIVTRLGVLVDQATLISTRPANPATVDLTVFNATDTPGQARVLTDALRVAGFESINPAKDDPLYPAKDLRCFGQIRYGEAGLNAARTILMVAPCAQLVLDSRVDDSVELSLGALYSPSEIPDTVVNQLRAIREAAAPPAVIEGQTASPRPQATIPPLPQVSCPS